MENDFLKFSIESATHSMAEIQEATDTFFREWVEKEFPTKGDEDLSKAIATLQIGKQLPIAPARIHGLLTYISSDGFPSIQAYFDEIDSAKEITMENLTDFAQQRMKFGDNPSGILLRMDKKK